MIIAFRCSGFVSVGSCSPQRTEDQCLGPQRQVWVETNPMTNPGSWGRMVPMALRPLGAARGCHRTSAQRQLVQAFILGRNLAVQFHPEMSSAILASWIATGGAEEINKLGIAVEELVRQTTERDASNRERAHKLVDLFLDRVAVQSEVGLG